MLEILKGAGIVDAKLWCGGADQMERTLAGAAESWMWLSCLAAMARSGQPHKNAPRRGRISSRLPAEQ